MHSWNDVVKKGFLIDDFKAYVDTIQWNWKPSLIVIHNTFIPSLADRPKGFDLDGINGLVGYYRDTLHWSGGPHLFITDTELWVFNPLNQPGVHSPSWNKISIGIEMLGNYDKEEFTSGRGLEVRNNAVAATAYLLSTLGLDQEAIKFHHEDPRTTHKNCPGKNVVKTDFLAAVDLVSQS